MMLDFSDEKVYEAEMAFLGSIMLSSDQTTVIEAVPFIAFLRPAHRVINRAMRAIVARALEIDILSLSLELQAEGRLDEVGGEEYILELAEFVPSPSNWQTYADFVLEAGERKAIESKCKRIMKLIAEGLPIADIRDAHDTPPKVMTAGRAPISSIKDIDISEDEIDGIPTGFDALDKLTGTGGFPSGQMSIVSAYHKGGKSTFMLSSFVNQAETGQRVLYATFADLNARRLKKRIMRNLTGWSKQPYNLQAVQDWDDALLNVNETWDAWIYDATALRNGGDVETFCKWLEIAHQRYKFDCVYVDYAQKITSRSPKANSPVSEQDICSTELSRVFERTGIAGVVGSQITEGGSDRKAITKGSRKWEEDAGLVLRISEETEKTKKVEIAYSRFGRDKVELIFDWSLERLRFEERAA